MNRTPVHRHPDADELIFIESGTGKVTLGDKVQLAHAGAIVFIPRDTWFGMENVGNDRLKNTAIWSAPGAEQYQRSISVPAGQPIVPLSKAEVDELHRKYSHYFVFQSEQFSLTSRGAFGVGMKSAAATAFFARLAHVGEVVLSHR